MKNSLRRKHASRSRQLFRKMNNVHDGRKMEPRKVCLAPAFHVDRAEKIAAAKCGFVYLPECAQNSYADKGDSQK